MTKHDCIHATHSALISDILVAHRHPIGMSMCDQSAKILDEDNFLIWKVRKEIIVSRNDFNRTFSQFCNLFFVSFRIPKMDQLLKWIFPLNSFLNSCMSSMRITHDQNFHLFHPSLFTKLSLHSDFICQSISSSRTHVRLGA